MGDAGPMTGSETSRRRFSPRRISRTRCARFSRKVPARRRSRAAEFRRAGLLWPAQGGTFGAVSGPNPEQVRLRFRDPRGHRRGLREGKVEGMATGTVKWFNDEKGYGFITADEGDPELFVHHRGVNVSGFKTLQENSKVSYDEEAGDKGPKAVNVTKL